MVGREAQQGSVCVAAAALFSVEVDDACGFGLGLGCDDRDGLAEDLPGAAEREVQAGGMGCRLEPFAGC